MPPHPPPDWAAIRIRYEETDDPVALICSDHAIDKEDLARIAKRECWRRQKPRPFPPLREPKTTPRAPSASRPAAETIDAVSPVSRSARPSARVRDRVGEGAAPPSPTDPSPEEAGATKPSRRSRARRIPEPKTMPAARRVSRSAHETPRSRPSRDAAGTAPPDVGSPDDGSGRSAPPSPPAKRPAARKTAATALLARRKLLDRMVAAISLKLEQLERRMARNLDSSHIDTNDDSSATDHERETRAIGALIDNLGKVTEMESGLVRTGKTDAAAADLGRDADRWRHELAQRLARIVGAAEPAP